MTNHDTTAELAISTATAKATYALSGATVIAGFTLPEWTALVGLGMSFAMFVLTVYLKIKAELREQAEHELRLAELRGAKNRRSECDEAK